ncbi:hypothetical protein DPMN_132040 [Dreissena polymorpha]|uniref:Uncharacterized protein n=1 Tax=Dreissena polymorpha TaxID=45954 RepID=A0A9D4FSK1_DREPO|nr:hypothetical protein DPMN_132040 [Dreissena polymorpha]
MFSTSLVNASTCNLPIDTSLNVVTYLGDINLGAFGPCHHHGLEVVELRQGLLGLAASLVSCIVEDTVHLVLERLSQRVTRCGLQLIIVSLLDDFYHIQLRTTRVYILCKLDLPFTT